MLGRNKNCVRLGKTSRIFHSVLCKPAAVRSPEFYLRRWETYLILNGPALDLDPQMYLALRTPCFIWNSLCLLESVVQPPDLTSKAEWPVPGQRWQWWQMVSKVNMGLLSMHPMLFRPWD